MNFFKNNGRHFIPLLTFNHALKKTFQMNIQNLMEFYISTFKSEASKQQSALAPSLFESATCKEINRHEDRIIFLTSDHRSTPKLRTYDTRLKTWNTQRIDLPLGKLFFFQNKYYSRSSRWINPYERVYSLYSSGIYPHPHIRFSICSRYLLKQIFYLLIQLITFKITIFFSTTNFTTTLTPMLFLILRKIFIILNKIKIKELYIEIKSPYSLTLDIMGSL